MYIVWRHNLRCFNFDVSYWCRRCRMDTPHWCHAVGRCWGFASICTPFCRCHLGLPLQECQISRTGRILQVWWAHGQNGGAVLAGRRHCWSPDLHLPPIFWGPPYNDFYVHLFAHVEDPLCDQYTAYCKDHKLPNNICYSFCRNLSTTWLVFFQWSLLELATTSDRFYILYHCICSPLLLSYRELVVLDRLAGSGY